MIVVITVVQILQGTHKRIEIILVATVHLVVFSVGVCAGTTIQ